MVVKRQITQDDINEFVRRGGPIWLFTKKEVENIPLDLIRPQYYAGTFNSEWLSEEKRKILDEELEKDPNLKKSREEALNLENQKEEEKDQTAFRVYVKMMKSFGKEMERESSIYEEILYNRAATIAKFASTFGEYALTAMDNYIDKYGEDFWAWSGKQVEEGFPALVKFYKVPRDSVVLYGLGELDFQNLPNECFLNYHYRDAIEIINKNVLSDSKCKEMQSYAAKKQEEAIENYIAERIDPIDGKVIVKSY